MLNFSVFRFNNKTLNFIKNMKNIKIVNKFNIIKKTF